MEFVNPSFLFALSAVSIPIIIHLFNFRRYKRVLFSNTKFLKEVQEETRSTAKLKHYLILISRILAVICLVLAFARPFIPNDGQVDAGSRYISIYVDNSFSMDGVNEDGRLLDQARKLAYDLVRSHAQSDRYMLITNDYDPAHSRFVTAEEIITFIDEIDLSPTVRKLSEIVDRQQRMTEDSEGAAILYLLGDAQISSYDWENVKQDSTFTLRFIPILPGDQPNLSIDSCWFENPVHQSDVAEHIHVRISNRGSQDLENIPVKLSINGNQRAVGSFNIRSESTIDTALTYTNSGTGIQHVAVSLTDYPVSFDDRYYVAYPLLDTLRVVVIGDSAVTGPFRALLGRDSLFRYAEFSALSVDYGSLRDAHLVILANLKSISSGLIQELKASVSGGGSLVVFPAQTANESDYNSLLNALNTGIETGGVDTSDIQVFNMDFEHPLFQGVFEDLPKNIDLPKLFYRIKFTKTGSAAPVLKLPNNEPYLLAIGSDQGLVYVFSAGIDEESGNLSKHALFVPLTYRMAVYRTGGSCPDMTIGVNDFAAIRPPDGYLPTEPIQCASLNGDWQMTPESRNTGQEIRLFFHDQVKQAGNFRLKWNGAETHGISFNYNRSESSLKSVESDELENLLQTNGFNPEKVILDASQGITSAQVSASTGLHLWKIFIILALVFFLIESVLLRFVK